ncbi:DUF805 domain-containing protein [Staphylococcus shinii]|uniref:DUF805 domain-containing protein n=1 Tax=Staphylococcus shinii TaxID=2912228 RepID=UPI002E18B70E|nr:DUF805 domain-containing protein [Staphylococcus shinii]
MERKIGFGQALKLYWKNYINFTGRSRRSEYWFMVLWHIIFLLPAIVLGFTGFFVMLAGASAYTDSTIGLGVLIMFLSIIYAVIYSLATLIPNWAILIRRFHDTGRTMLMPLIYLGLSVIANIVNFIIELNDPNETNIMTSIILIVFGLANLGLGIYMIVIACLDSERKINTAVVINIVNMPNLQTTYKIIIQIHLILNPSKMIVINQITLKIAKIHLMKSKNKIKNGIILNIKA